MEEAKRFCNPDIIDKKTIVEAYTDGSYIKRMVLRVVHMVFIYQNNNLKKGKKVIERK